LLLGFAGSGCQLAVDFDRARIAPAQNFAGSDAAVPDGGIGGDGGTTATMSGEQAGAGAAGASDVAPDAGLDAAVAPP
jgi:hypothetical protein